MLNTFHLATLTCALVEGICLTQLALALGLRAALTIDLHLLHTWLLLQELLVLHTHVMQQGVSFVMRLQLIPPICHLPC
jgi:hypothetical protein